MFVKFFLPTFPDNPLSPFPSAKTYEEEEEPRRKAILYEDLRLKNRENYEVTLTQKAETLLKTSPEKEPKGLKKEGELLPQRCVEHMSQEQLRGFTDASRFYNYYFCYFASVHHLNGEVR